jgi:hypothetical protein
MGALLAVPALADDPGVTKQTIAEDDGTFIILVNVSARDRDIYGITLEDREGSIIDISSPDGWAGIASEDMIVFRTVDEPITTGMFAAFRLVTNKRPDLRISFRDDKSSFGLRKSL